MEELTFREYSSGDFQRCAELALEAWPVARKLVRKEEDGIKLVQAYVRLSLLYSTRMEVAVISGKVVGFLFGRAKKEFRFWQAAKLVLIAPFLLFGILVGRYGRLLRPLWFVRKYITNEREITRAVGSSFDGEVVLFVVGSESRGQGVGRSLLDRFLKYSTDLKAKSVYLSTDDWCNWQFYEKYGFKRYAQWKEDILSELSGETVFLYVYVIDLPSQ